KLYSGEEVPKDYMENITTLCETAKKVAKIVNTATVSYDNLDYWASEIENKIDSTVDDSLSAFLEKTEGEFVDYPTLVYDGPYSDHLLESESAMLEDADTISEDEAKTIACQFSGCEDRELELISEEKGKIESFRFSNGKTNITVSKNGGFVVYMRKETTAKEHIITYKQALLKAKRFLQQNGLESFIETYYFTDEGVCVINFAYLDGQTICYTDLIKVGVAMDSGEIVLYEAAGFISNHKPRAFETATTTEKQAAEKLSHELKIIKASIALIPTKSGGEARCYEFLCTDGETEVLVYINLLNLRQEEVLILLKGDGGTLAK
ncbi:MAG: germination protein YpeB, partial [Clostridia bacterium]|nr:germination protein YpeB [Clostridia bacterium]